MIPEVILRVDWLQTHSLFIMSMPKNIGIICEISTLNQYILELFWVAFCHTDNRPTLRYITTLQAKTRMDTPTIVPLATTDSSLLVAVVAVIVVVAVVAVVPGRLILFA